MSDSPKVSLNPRRIDTESGVIDTPMLRKSTEISGSIGTGGAAMKRQGQPTEVADLIAFLLSDSSTFISGAVHNIDGAWHC